MSDLRQENADRLTHYNERHARRVAEVREAQRPKSAPAAEPKAPKPAAVKAPKPE